MSHPEPHRRLNNLTSCLPIVRQSNGGKKLQKESPSQDSASTASLTSRFSFEPFKRTFSKRRNLRPSDEANSNVKSTPRIVSDGDATLTARQIEYRWQGSGQSPTVWDGFGNDTDLWMADEECLIFFEEPEMRNPPTPYFRLDKAKLSQCGLPFLEALVAAAEQRPTERTIRRFGNANTLSPVQQFRRRSLHLLPMVKTFSPLKLPQIEQEQDVNGNRSSWTDRRKSWMGNDNRWSQFLQNGVPPTQLIAKETVELTFDVWFAVPEGYNPMQIYRHKLAVRNILAMLHRKPLVGSDFVHMLKDMRDVLVVFCSTPGKLAAGEALKLMIAYLADMCFDDVRYEAELAFSLLAWSELPNVKFNDGYLECFVHIVGMMSTNPSLVETLTSRILSRETQTALRHAQLTLKKDIANAERKLAAFDFSEMMQNMRTSPARKAFDAFRSFLIGFLEEKCGSWPPKMMNAHEQWLNRDVIRMLQHDIGELYDDLVDIDIYWDRLRAVYRREWEMVSLDSNHMFQADQRRVPVTDVLVAWDKAHGFTHMPMPYPLLPEEQPQQPKLKTSGSSLLSSFRRSSGTPVQDCGNNLNKDNKFETSSAYAKATNATSQNDGNLESSLLAAFEEHERETYIADCTLQEARLGRWLLLYGIMQVLSSLSTDVLGVKHKDGVRYFLSASLEGCPLWLKPTQIEEATREGSFLHTVLDRGSFGRPTQEKGSDLPSGEAAKVREERYFSIKRKPLPATPRESACLTSPISPVSIRPISSSPNAMKENMAQSVSYGSLLQARHERMISTATADSQWTDIEDTGSGRPSTSTMREGDAQAIPVQRGVLTEIRGRPVLRADSVTRRSSGFVEHLEESVEEGASQSR